MNEIEELYNDINNALAKCGKCEDSEFYGEKGCCQNKRIAKALYNAGYHKTKVKTIGDKIRSMTDKELANLCIATYWNYNADEPCCISTITHCVYSTYFEAYNANLEWLKKEYKGE